MNSTILLCHHWFQPIRIGFWIPDWSSNGDVCNVMKLVNVRLSFGVDVMN